MLNNAKKLLNNQFKTPVNYYIIKLKQSQIVQIRREKMKRKIALYALLVVALCVIFAIGISAATTNEFGTPEVLDGIDLTNMSTDSVARVVLKDGDEYHTYPAQYIVTNADTLTYDFTRIQKVNGKSYSKNSVVRIEIPDPVLIMPATGILCSCAELVEIKFSPKSECHTLSYGCFYDNKKMKTVYVPPKVTTMGTLIINNSTIEELIFMDGFSAVPPKESFVGATGLKRLVFSNQMTTMHPKAFHSTINTKVEEIRFGESLLDLGEKVAVEGGGSQGNFAWLQGNGVTRLYASEKFFSQIETIEKGHTSGWTGTSAKRGVVFYTGTQAQAKALIDKADSTAQVFYGATLLEWDPTKEDTDAAYQPSSGWIIVYNYNKCKAFYGNEHEEQVLNGCLFGCARGCGAVEMLANPEHSYQKTVLYGDSTAVDFYKAITICNECANCKHTTQGASIEPLFTSKGFSISLEGDGITQNFGVNLKAVQKYKENVNPSFEYGLVASASEGTPISLVEGVLTTGANTVMAKMSDTDFEFFEIKIMNLSVDYADTKVVSCAYVFDGTTVYYLSEGVTGASVTGKSYSDVKAG